MLGAKASSLLLLDSNTRGKISIFFFTRLLLITLVLLSTIFLKQDVLGEQAVAQVFAALAASFFLALVNVAFWEEALKVPYFMPSQLLYDLLLTSFLVYLTGVDDSIFLFLYLLNIVFASIIFQRNGALLVSSISGLTFAFIYYANNDMDQVTAWYALAWHELLFLLTALLCGQLMDELKRQKVMLEAQQASIERLELLNDSLLNSIPLGIVLIDENEYVLKVNMTALDFMVLKRPPAFQMKYYELLPDLKGIFEAWEKMNETQRLRYFFRSRSGHSLSLQIVRLTGKLEPGMGRSILVFQDVTKLQEMEEKLEFESKLAATGELAAGIAHEIRNPLASISGSIELLSQNVKIENDQDKRLMQISLKEIHRLNTLITDFLEFAKPKDESAEDFSLSAVIAEVAEAIQSRDSDSQVQITNDVPLETMVHASQERMKQVFYNLFLNAIEAAEGKPIHIRVAPIISLPGHVSLTVQDNGPGIDPEIREQVFDPFFTTKDDGTGLGLPTVAQICRAAKGEISLMPSDRGACFRLTLPISLTAMEDTAI